jgi:hypothetical protein
MSQRIVWTVQWRSRWSKEWATIHEGEDEMAAAGVYLAASSSRRTDRRKAETGGARLVKTVMKSRIVRVFRQRHRKEAP